MLKSFFAKTDKIRQQILKAETVAPTKIGDYFSYSGTVAVALLVIQAMTGVMLFFYYSPQVERAFSSLVTIKNEIPYGMLFATIHAVNAKFIVLVLFIHMFRIMLHSAFRGPRAPQWYTGAALLTVMLVTGFSGYLLPWSQQSYWACVIGTEAVRAVPLIGDFLMTLTRGGREVSGTTLSIFYVLHILVLPAAIIVLIWYHIKQVWKTGVIAPPSMRAIVDNEKCLLCGHCLEVCWFGAIQQHKKHKEKRKIWLDGTKCNACRACITQCPAQCMDLISEKRGRLTWEPIFPHNTLHRAQAVIISIITLFILTFLFHGILLEVKIPADPLLTPNRIKPDWYFLGAYQLLKVFPGELSGLLALVAIYLLMIFLPKIDRTGPRDLSRRPVYIPIVKTVIALFVIFTIWGHVS